VPFKPPLKILYDLDSDHLSVIGHFCLPEVVQTSPTPKSPLAKFQLFHV
jgi:hypothetical protein